MEKTSFIVWIVSVGILSVFWLVLFLSNYHHKRPVLSLWTMFWGNLIVYLLMFGSCFILFDANPGWPESTFWILFFAYIIAELISLVFFITPDWGWFQARLDCFHSKVGTNPLKGWGGETFADLSNSFGILVVVGINVVLHASTGSFWWVGQIAALMSIMGAAAWVQRFSFEAPRVYRGWREYLPKFLDIIAGMLTVLIVVMPNVGSGGAETRTKWLWFVVFLVWAIMALFAWVLSSGFRGHTLPLWPKSQEASAGNRGNIGRFLFGILLSTIIVAIGILVGIPDNLGSVLGYITTFIFLISQFIGLVSVLPDPRSRAGIELEEAFKLLKSLGFILIGLFLIFVQMMGEQWLVEEAIRVTYLATLSAFGTLAFIGVLADACRMAQKWAAGHPTTVVQPQPASPAQSKPADLTDVR